MLKPETEKKKKTLKNNNKGTMLLCHVLLTILARAIDAGGM